MMMNSENLDKNQEKRAAYYREILLKEDQLDDLRRERNRAVEAIEDIQGQLHTDYRQLEELEYALSAKGSMDSQKHLHNLSDSQRLFEQKLYQAYEDIQSAYQTLNRRLENDVEQLHQERNALPWD